MLNDKILSDEEIIKIFNGKRKPLSDEECIALGKLYGEVLIKAQIHVKGKEGVSGDDTLTQLFAYNMLNDATTLVEHVELWELAIEKENEHCIR